MSLKRPTLAHKATASWAAAPTATAPKKEQTARRGGRRIACCVNERYSPFDASLMGGGQGQLSSIDYARLQSTTPSVPIGSGKVGVPHGFYDAHVHLYDFNQKTEGIAALLECMDECGVSHAAIMGCPLKKNWSEFETRMSENVYNDTDVLYYFSLTDLYLLNQLKMLPPEQAGRFAPQLCGFKPTDRHSPQQIDALIDGHPEIQWRGLGKLILRFSEVTNLTVGSVPYPGHPALNGIMHEAQRRNLPVMIQHNACSESTKPYKYGFEYTGELEEMLQAYDDVNVLWVDAGIYVRGQWAGYKEELARLMKGNKNLYISITPTVLKLQKIASKDLLEIAEMYPDHVMLGSSTIGTFKDAGSNPAADSGARTGKYKKDWELMKKWAGQLSRETYKKVTFTNAFHLFKHRADNEKFDGGKSFENKITYTSAHQVRTVSSKLHNMENAKQKDYEPPAEKNRMLSGMTDGKLMHDGEIKHVVIDTHLHMLDFLHKSSGTRKILQAMDGCGVEKAVLIGMPCCKKWSKDEPEQPLYYQDDNGQCYFYSYSDQMVADAWMALPDDKRCRFAPVMAGFNPTDINAIAHVERMWDKYPGLWRGLGEVMCRHDDLTMLLQDDECPVINHMAMRPLYEFCIKHDLNCLVHHNADRTAEEESDDHYEYLWEVEQVLTTFPDLKLVWCHAGASRRTHEASHADMIEKMVNTYPNLMIDMSWVVWEECVLDPVTGKIEKQWIDAFEKHPTRFTMGSDCVGQFISPNGGNILKPEIVKYWVLAEACTPATTKAILYDNAQRIWFDRWELPTTDQGGRWEQAPPVLRAETLFHNQGYFENIDEEMY